MINAEITDKIFASPDANQLRSYVEAHLRQTLLSQQTY